MIALLVIESAEAEATQVSVYNISADSASADMSVVKGYRGIYSAMGQKGQRCKQNL